MKKMKRKTNLTSEICLGSNEKTQKFEVFSLPHIFQDTIIYAPNTQWNPGRLLFLVHIHSQKKTSIHISNICGNVIHLFLQPEVLLGLEYKSRGFSQKLRPGKLLHGHNSVNSPQILMGLQRTLPISLDRVYPKYQND